MQTTKAAFMVMIGLAMIDPSAGHSLNAATTIRIQELSFTTTKPTSPASSPGKSHKSMNGLATVYSNQLSGRKTASGQMFCQTDLTAAHRSLPLGTKVLITNTHNSKSVEVTINDRGPFVGKRIIDLSKAAATELGSRNRGVTSVCISQL